MLFEKGEEFKDFSSINSAVRRLEEAFDRDGRVGFEKEIQEYIDRDLIYLLCCIDHDERYKARYMLNVSDEILIDYGLSYVIDILELSDKLVLEYRVNSVCSNRIEKRLGA